MKLMKMRLTVLEAFVRHEMYMQDFNIILNRRTLGDLRKDTDYSGS
jgi:hypothetical protein